MIDERHEELAALYALDLLEGAEREQFEAAVARNPQLQALARELRESSTALAHTATTVEPPRELKQRVLASIEARGAQAGAADETKIIRPPEFGFRQFLPWAAAACLAVTAGWFAYRSSVSESEASLLREKQTLAELAMKSSQNQLEAERLIHQRRVADLGQQVAQLTEEMRTQGDISNLKITALASLLKNSPLAQAVAVWDPIKQKGVLKVQNMPALGSNEDHQLWVIDAANPDRPIDGGVFSLASGTVSFTAKEPITAVVGFAVSRERKGGVPKAEGEMVLLGK